MEDDLRKILNDHKTWLVSRGREGRRARLLEARMTKAPLPKADLRAAELTRAHLTKADLAGARLDRADLREADLTGANLKGASLPGAGLQGACLRAADLRSALLTGADLKGVDLAGADLTGADLSGADLSGAELIGADLTIAVLTEANLTGADLTESDLRGADLTRTDLRGARLEGADLALTRRQETRMGDRRVLQTIKGLKDDQGIIFDKQTRPEKGQEPLGQEQPLDLPEGEARPIMVRLPDNYGPADSARVLVYLAMMTRGGPGFPIQAGESTEEYMDQIRSLVGSGGINSGGFEASGFSLVPSPPDAAKTAMEAWGAGAGGTGQSALPALLQAREIQQKQELIRSGIETILPILQAINLPSETRTKAAAVLEKYLGLLERMAEKMASTGKDPKRDEAPAAN